MDRRGWAAVLVLAAVCTLGGVYAEEFLGQAAVAQYGLPVPPMQQKPWTPPESALGNTFAGAVAVLFEQGLPDPRGCEYREVMVPRLFARGEMEHVKTDAWVLPRSSAFQTFAICWDGLIWPVEYLGEPADLQADVAAALRKEDDLRAERLAQNPGVPFMLSWGMDWTERAINADVVLPLRACLLLRLGEAGLAGQMWQAVVRDYGWSMGPGMHGEDPFLLFAADWAWAKYERALVFHCRGVNPLALADLKGLDGLQQSLLDQAAGRGYPRDVAQQLLAFLDEAPKMLADQQRRRGVNELIRDLEDVHLAWGGDSGGYRYSGSATMVELVLMGEPAVDPLLRAMESESRLSRTMRTGRMFSRVGSIVPVSGLERTAVDAILGDPPVKDSASLRSWWQANRDRPFLERLYAALADDDAGPDMWLWAAERIVQPTDEPGAMFHGDFITSGPVDFDSKKPPKWSGEPLRDRRGPSVSELMARRALALAKMGAPVERPWRMTHATSMGVMLARWDARAALETLRALDHSWRDALGVAAGKTPSGGQSYSSYLADLALARIHCGDDQAMHDYADWLKTGSTLDTRPLWLEPEDPAVVSAAEWLAQHLDLLSIAERQNEGLEPCGPMLAVRPFREYVLRELHDDEAVGYILVRPEKNLELRFRGWEGPFPKERPVEGTKVFLRAKDTVAWNLARLTGFPQFNPFAPQEERDRLVAECIRILEEEADSLSPMIDIQAFWARWLRGRSGDSETLLKDTSWP